MKRLALIAGLAALSSCAQVPLGAPGPLSAGRGANSPMGWARLADLQDSLQGESPSQALAAYLACADAAERSGDNGAAVLCLEAAYRYSFRQSGVQRWVQEEQRAKLARRLQAIKAEQGRPGAAVSYGIMAALSEAYLDGGQADDDKKAYADAQARIEEARQRKAQADAQAMANLFSGVMSNALNAGMGVISSDQATLNMLQTEINYIQDDSKISEASKGLGEAEGALQNSTVRAAEDRASRLLAAFLAGTSDCVPYARAVQAELKKSPLGGRPAVAEFVALPAPDRSRSSKRDFARAFQAAEKDLWTADLKQGPLSLAAAKPEDLGGDWDQAQSYSQAVPYLQYWNEASYKRIVSFDETGSGVALKKPVTLTANVKSTNGGAFGAEIRPYPGGGFYGNFEGGMRFSDLSFPAYLTATGSSWGLGFNLGCGVYLPLGSQKLASLSLGVMTTAFEMGSSDFTYGKLTYSTFEFQTLGVDLDASLRLFDVLKIGVAVPLASPIGTGDVVDAGGLKLKLGMVFAFESVPKASALKAAEAGELPPLSAPSGGTVTRVKTGRPTEQRPSAGVSEAKVDATPAPTPAPTVQAAGQDDADAQAAEDARQKKEAADKAEADAKAKKKAAADAKAAAAAKKKKADAQAQADAEAKLEAEKQAVADEKAALEKEKARLALEKERQALAEEKRKLQEEREALQREREAAEQNP